MPNSFFLYRGGHPAIYAASIAATWVWAPALFVASSMAYTHGLAGLLMFLIPNALTLVLFGWVASRIAIKGNTFTVGDVVAVAGAGQKRMHLGISVVLLICSTAVQLVGMHVLLSEWFGFPKWLSALGVGLFSLVMVARGGIRASVLTDVVKYGAIVFVGASLIHYSPSELRFEGIGATDIWTLWWVFGLPTTIGLLAAPYVDQTFWQRAMGIEPARVFSTFCLAAMLFTAVPAAFGLVGLMAEAKSNWSLASAFSIPYVNALIGLAVFAALVSTIDSNLCAVSSLAWREWGFERLGAWIVMIALLLLAGGLMVGTSLSIVELFLIYGTVRTVACVPTVLIVFGKFNATRLFWATLLTLVIAPTGFVICKWLDSPFAAVFTVLALTIPLLGMAWRDNQQ